MRFVKMHGIGNDYVYVDAFSQTITQPEILATRVADRHFGIGGDGLILVAPPTDPAKHQGATVRMRMFNADGSEAEMCGNGIRCVAKFLYEHGINRKPTLRIETGRGILTLDIQTRNGAVHLVRVDMGEPILEAARIPTTLAGNPPTDA